MAKQQHSPPKVPRQQAVERIQQVTRDRSLTTRIEGCMHFGSGDTLPGKVVDQVCMKLSSHIPVPKGEYCRKLEVNEELLGHVLSCMSDGRILDLVSIANPRNRLQQQIYVVNGSESFDTVGRDLTQIREDLDRHGLSWLTVAERMVTEKGMKLYSIYFDYAINFLLDRSGNTVFARSAVDQFMEETEGYRELPVTIAIKGKGYMVGVFDALRRYKGDYVKNFQFPAGDGSLRDIAFVQMGEGEMVDIDTFSSELGLDFRRDAWNPVYFQ